jgi:glycerophosphoryl diester phosphodiesterase
MPRRVRENTLPSFDAALEAGAEGIELDVHATSDGVVVVHHDPHLRGGTEIASSDWATLRRTGASLGVELPTLGEVCALVSDRVELFVEIKGAGIERAVLEVLAGHRGRCAIHSFDHAMIARIAQLDQRMRLGLLFDEWVPDVVGVLTAHGALDAWPRHSLVDAALVDAVHGAGGRVIAWTANDARTIARLTGLHVDGICTDDVTLLAPS